MVKPTFWFSYSTIYGLDAPEPPNSPYSLTWNVGRFLRNKATAHGYAFRYVNLDDLGDYAIQPDDIIFGHSWYPEGFLTRAFDKPARAKFLIQPYQHDIVGKNESWWIRRLADAADHLFFVTGPYWWDTMHEGLYGDWKAKATRLDMAINPALHPHSKTRWNAPGKRRVLAIGTDIPYKGLDMIADLAQKGGFHLGYFGSADPAKFRHVPQFAYYGGCDFTPAVQAAITRDYDCFISLAYGDANPTTLLETASWGLLPLCNKESGYWADAPFLELRKSDMAFNLAMIDHIQQAPEYALRQRAAAIRREVVERHSWERFTGTVWSEVSKWI